MRFVTRFKKMITLVGISVGFSFLWTSGSLAQSGDEYLKAIAENTKGILTQVDLLPTYFDKIVQNAISWLATDDSEETAKMQEQFNKLGTFAGTNAGTQTSMQNQFSADIVGVPLGDLTGAEGKAPPIKDAVPEVNNLMYSSMMGKVPSPSLPFDPKEYVKYAGGISLANPTPQTNWAGTPGARQAYKNYYDTVSAAKSFSAYVLSNLVAENQGGNQVTAIQNDLINKATDSTWILKITTEELGKVLRQILVFQSQSYVLQMQQLQVQKQLLTAAAITNSLLIATNTTNENYLLMDAKGLIPGGKK